MRVIYKMYKTYSYFKMNSLWSRKIWNLEIVFATATVPIGKFISLPSSE